MGGRLAVITGGNGGVGLATAARLAAAGYGLAIAARPGPKTRQAVARLCDLGADAQSIDIDLASLESARQAGEALAGRRIDILIANAGVMWAPPARTVDGHEIHFGVNHLGHFQFIQPLVPGVVAASGRVVVISSPAHRRARLPLDPDRPGRPIDHYADSKLANLWYALELNRRLAGTGADAVAAHPGSARTELNRTMPWFVRGRSWGLARPITHSVEAGAAAVLYAALDPGVRGGDYVGPTGFAEFRGRPGVLALTDIGRDARAAADLWSRSEDWTGAHYAFDTNRTTPDDDARRSTAADQNEP